MILFNPLRGKIPEARNHLYPQTFVKSYTPGTWLVCVDIVNAPDLGSQETNMQMILEKAICLPDVLSSFLERASRHLQVL